MSKTKNILVTGAGALLGQGILRSLRRVTGHDFRIITADPDHRSTGHWLGDAAVIIPMARDENYFARIEEIIVEYTIDLVLVGTDVELFIFSEKRSYLEEKYNCSVIVSPRETIQIGDNKWDTVKYLKENGFPYPDSALSNDYEGLDQLIQRQGFPLFAKPAVGARSVGVKVLNGQEDVDALKDSKGTYIIQELLDEDQGEFTAGTMVFGGEILFTIILRRDLRDGNTYRAYSVNDESLKQKLDDIISKLDIYGPCNFQFRLRDGEPVIFEVNSRFSGTTPIRDFFGINELQILMDYLFNGQKPVDLKIKEGAVLRAFSDLFVSADQLDKLQQEGRLDNPEASYFPFLDK